MTACSRSTPVSRCAWRTMLTTPACPQPVITTRPRPRTLTTSAWSSRTAGSCRQWRPSQAWWGGGMPRSNSVVRSTSPVIRMLPPASSDGWRRSMTWKPSRSRAPADRVGSSNGVPSGQGQPAPGPHRRVHGQRQAGPAAQPGQPGEAARVVEVAVAEHHRPARRPGRARGSSALTASAVRGRRRCRTASVVDWSPRRDGDQGREAVLGPQPGTVVAAGRTAAPATRPVRPNAGPGDARRPTGAGRRRRCRPGW